MKGQTELGWEIIVAPLIILAILLTAYQIGMFKTNVDTEIASKCAQYPELLICKTSTETSNYAPDLTVATTSTEALTCAINSVATGAAQTCVQKFSGGIFESSTVKKPVVDCQVSGYPEVELSEFPKETVVAPNQLRPLPVRYRFNSDKKKWEVGINSIWHEVDRTTYKPGEPHNQLIKVIIGSNEKIGFQSILNIANQQESDVGIYYPNSNIQPSILARSAYNYNIFAYNSIPTDLDKYNIKLEGCAVKNFNLPQEVTDGQKWIANYGDPKFIVYWQNFPLEEDTWTTQINWKVHALILGASFLPVGKIAGQSLKFFTAAKKVANAAGPAAATAHEASRVAEAAAVKATTREAVKEVNEGFLKATLKNVVSVKRLAAAGTLEGVVWISAYVKSVLNKYDPKPGNIVLKIPLEDPKTYSLDGSWVKRPVILNYRPEVRAHLTTAHIVSPCKIDKLPVIKSATSCSLYSVSAKDGKVTCLNPDYIEGEFKNSDLHLCEKPDASKGIEDRFSNDFINYFKSFEGQKLPSFMKNYFVSENMGGFFNKNVKYVVTDSKDFAGDKLIIGSTEFDIKSVVAPSEPTNINLDIGGVAKGNIDVSGAGITVYKYCPTWYDKKLPGSRFIEEVEAGRWPELSCQIGIHIDSQCIGAGEKNDICNEIKNIASEETYRATFTHPIRLYTINGEERVFGGGFQELAVNKYIEFTYYKKHEDKPTDSTNQKSEDPIGEERQSRSRGEILMGGYSSSIGLVDTDLDNNFDSIVFYKDSLHAASGNHKQRPSKPTVVISDTDFDGMFESTSAYNCKIESVVVDLDKADGKEGYCAAEKGWFRSSAKYAGFGIAAVGAVASIIYSVGGTVPFLGSALAGSLFVGGLTISSVAEFTEAMGNWPRRF